MNGTSDQASSANEILLTALLEQARLNFRIMQMFAGLAEGRPVAYGDAAELAGIVAKMSEMIPALAKELRGISDER